MRHLILCGGILLAAGLAGCSEGGASKTRRAVSGKVILPSGQSGKGAEVYLVPIPKEGLPLGMDASGLLEADGSFKMKSADGLDGVHDGYYKVVVRPYGKASADKGAAYRGIPRHYWSEDTTKATVEITADKPNWEVKLDK